MCGAGTDSAARSVASRARPGSSGSRNSMTWSHSESAVTRAFSVPDGTGGTGGTGASDGSTGAVVAATASGTTRSTRLDASQPAATRDGEAVGVEAIQHARRQLGAVTTSVLKELQHVAPVQPCLPTTLVRGFVRQRLRAVVQYGQRSPDGGPMAPVGGRRHRAARAVQGGEQLDGSLRSLWCGAAEDCRDLLPYDLRVDRCQPGATAPVSPATAASARHCQRSASGARR